MGVVGSKGCSVPSDRTRRGNVPPLVASPHIRCSTRNTACNRAHAPRAQALRHAIRKHHRHLYVACEHAGRPMQPMGPAGSRPEGPTRASLDAPERRQFCEVLVGADDCNPGPEGAHAVADGLRCACQHAGANRACALHSLGADGVVRLGVMNKA